jgi:hypothetical protein
LANAYAKEFIKQLVEKNNNTLASCWLDALRISATKINLGLYDNDNPNQQQIATHDLKQHKRLVKSIFIFPDNESIKTKFETMSSTKN